MHITVLQDKATDSAWRTPGQGLEGLLAASTAEAIAASQNAYTDTQKLLAVLQEVTAARDSFRAEANTAQAAEVRARSAESESRAASQDAQQATQNLQLLLASCTAERDRLEEQRATTARANAEARALSQQSQQDAQALHEAAAEAKAMCKALSSQVSELQSAKAEAQATVQSAQQMSDKLDVDVEAARLTLESHTTRLQTVTADGLAACTALQVTTYLCMSQHSASCAFHLCCICKSFRRLILLLGNGRSAASILRAGPDSHNSASAALSLKRMPLCSAVHLRGVRVLIDT